MGELIADIFGSSDEEGEFEGFEKRDLEKTKKDNRIDDDDDDEDDRPLDMAPQKAASSDDESRPEPSG